MKMSKLMKTATRYTSEHLPQILLGIGIGGMVGAVATAIKSTPKAMDKIDNKKEELEKESLSVKETVQATWKCYAPTVILMILSTACVVSANNINERRKGAIMAALTLSETTYREFKDAAKEIVGEEKAKEISEKAQNNRMDNAQVPQVVVIRGDGQLFFDPTTNAKFPSTVNKLKSVANDLNKEMRDCCFVTLNDFYVKTGRQTTAIGDAFGWDINRNGYVEFEFTPHYDDESGDVEYYLSFENEPIRL